MNDRELLELAAKAACITILRWGKTAGAFIGAGGAWSPLTDDGHALRLAVTLKMQIILHKDWVEILINGIQAASCDSCYASGSCMLETTRRAIVKAAAYTLSAEWATSSC